MEDKTETKKINLFKILQNVAIVGLFLLMGIGVLIGVGVIEYSVIVIQWNVIVALIFLGVLLALPWAKYIEKKEYKIVSIVFLTLALVCIVLWIISTFVVCSHIEAGTISAGLINLMRITLIISLQMIISTIIGSFVIKYKSKYIPFQAITYLGLAFIDFYAVTLLVATRFVGGELVVSEKMQQLLFNKTTLGILLVAFIYIIAAFVIVYGSKKRSIRNRLLSPRDRYRRDLGLIDVYEEEEEETQPDAPDAEKQLEKLKAMLDKNLITKEEYDAKRKEVIDKM